MAIFSSLASFFRRNKRNLLITSAFAVSIYILIDQLVIKKFRNFQNSLRQELIFKQQIKQRFIQTQLDCYYTILALLPVLSLPIVDHLPVELITQALRLKKTNPAPVSNVNSDLTTDNLNLLENNTKPESKLLVYVNKSKIELWNLLKIKTITRTLSLMYSISGLLLITRLQLNILARMSYLESAILMAGVKSKDTSSQVSAHENYVIEQSYLSLSWWLLNKGWLNLNAVIEPLVVASFEKINPKSELSINQFESILLNISKDLEYSPALISNLFPLHYDDLIETFLNTNPDLISHLENPESNLYKLVNETKLIISTGENAPYFRHLYHELIVNNLSTLSDQLVLSLNHGSSSLLLSSSNLKDEEKITEINQELETKQFKLASFLAQLSIQNSILIDNNNFSENDQDLEGFIDELNDPRGIIGDSGRNGELTGNIYVNNLNELEELDDFSAGVYSNYE